MTARLDLLRARVGAAADPIARLVERGTDDELFRTSPACAGASLEAMLHAAHVGLFELEWGLRCPQCLGFLSGDAGLRALVHARRCMLCKLNVEPAVDENVEVAFTVAPAVRSIRWHDPARLGPEDATALLWSGSVTHAVELRRVVEEMVVGRAAIDPGGAAVLELELDGEQVVLAGSVHAGCYLVPDEGAPPEGTIVVAGRDVAPVELRLHPSKVRVRIENQGRARVLAVAIDYGRERMTEGGDGGAWLSARELLTSQAFRDLFRTESLPADGGLAVKSLTILFTDLRGSTELYDRVGDLNAFALVRRHFAALSDEVRQSGGAIVKTIGDAIMACFPDPPSALRAANAMHGRMAAIDPRLALKVGIHAGPCIAVELNERLDYFGQTVNVAARVQGIAGGHETVVTEAVSTEGARELVHLKGVGGEVAIRRRQWVGSGAPGGGT